MACSRSQKQLLASQQNPLTMNNYSDGNTDTGEMIIAASKPKPCNPLHIALLSNKETHSDLIALQQIFSAYSNDKEIMMERDSLGNNIIHTLVQLNNNFLFDLIINLIPDKVLLQQINEKNLNGDTPLHLAIRNDNEGIFFYKLLKLNADIEIKNAENLNSLQLAISRQNTDAIIIMFKNGKSIFNVIDALMPTPSSSIGGSKLSTFGYAITQKLPNYILYNFLQIIKDVNFIDDKGNNYLHLAVKTNNLELVEQLLIANVNLKIENVENKTPIHIAIEKNNVKMVKKLLIAWPNKYYQQFGTMGTLLHSTCRQFGVDFHQWFLTDLCGNNKEIIIQLLNNANEKDDLMTPLMIAIKHQPKNKELIKLLIHKGANLKINDVYGRNALEYINKYGGEGMYEDIMLFK